MRRAIISAVDVNEVLLPGIGLHYEFTSSEGRRLGIVARHREGDFELVAYAVVIRTSHGCCFG